LISRAFDLKGNAHYLAQISLPIVFECKNTKNVAAKRNAKTKKRETFSSFSLLFSIKERALPFFINACFALKRVFY